jgi:signal transduction histidine kinase
MTQAHRSIPFAATGTYTAVIVVLFLVAAGALAAVYEESFYQAQRQTALRQTAEILAASVTAAVSFDDREAAQEYVTPLRVNASVEAAAVYDHDGRLLAGFARKGTLPRRLPAAAGNTVADVVVPVTERGSSFGQVYLRASPEPFETRLLRYAVLVLLACMAAVVVAGLANAQSKLQRQANSLGEANDRLQREIAERTKAEEALRQSQKMEAIGQLSGGIAHDFNNHLMIIKGNLHLLKRRLGLTDSDRHLRAAIEGVDRAASLTQRILSFSRRQSLNPAPLDLNTLVTGMNQLIRSSLRENIAYVETLHAASDVVADRNQMENVILNLVLNARDAMPGGGRLEIRTDDLHVSGAQGELPEGDYVRLAVGDTGVGMTEDVRRKALDPFFTTKPVGQGTGLGLSTTYGFVTQSGGHIGIDSVPGKGTTISVFLPKARPLAASGRSGGTWQTS